MSRKPGKCAEWKENTKNLTNDQFGPTFDDTSEIYTDKNVVEHPSAMLIDCCRETKNSCSVVKDIVVDDGVPLEEKILEQTLKKINDLEDFDFSSKISLAQGDRRGLSNDINEVSGRTADDSLMKDLSDDSSNVSYNRLDLGQSQSSGDYPSIVACASSLSSRSDSSSTSSRSFAFPILQSEWNSSPIRMAKGDRRNLRRLRCWWEGLFCCRF